MGETIFTYSTVQYMLYAPPYHGCIPEQSLYLWPATNKTNWQMLGIEKECKHLVSYFSNLELSTVLTPEVIFSSVRITRKFKLTNLAKY